MEIVLLEPFLTGSHASWAQEYAERSRHQVRILGLEGRYWKWRMHGGAVSLASQFRAAGYRPDLLLATDMLDLTTFLALTRDLTAGIPTAIYFHENQLTYPWSPADTDPARQRDAHYRFINYSSALAADAVLFNSDFHRRSFLQHLPVFLKRFPDHRELATVDEIALKSRVLALGLNLRAFDAYRVEKPAAGPRKPLLLWNHRWEYDKNPDDFFQALFHLQERQLDFEVAVLGQSYRSTPAIFGVARQRLAERIIHWGYVSSFAEYAKWLWRADILPVTSLHDFFGVSVVQAIYCQTFPLLPQRLAYPEHVAVEEHPHCYYEGFDDLVSKLEDRCRADGRLPENQLRQSMAQQYEWSQLVSVYDRTLEEVALA